MPLTNAYNTLTTCRGIVHGFNRLGVRSCSFLRHKWKFLTELEISGRAQREAARRPQSDWRDKGLKFRF